MAQTDQTTAPRRSESSPSYSAHFLVGPTASGKTAVAHCLAKAEGWDILSADSMLVYRGMDIGTAKPDRRERGEVRYAGIDLVTPAEMFSAGAFLERARDAVKRAREGGREMIVVGGTGLYIRCLTEGLDAAPAIQPAIRARAEALLAEKGVSALQEHLQRQDPARFEALKDKDNPRRLIRAIELAETSASRNRTWRVLPESRLVGLAMDPAALAERIRTRALRMFENGLVEEAAQLREHWPELSRTALQAIGYAEAFQVLDGTLGREEALERVVTRTRQLAKRQMTWFRHQARVEWINVDAGDDVETVARRVTELWRRHGPTALGI